MSKAKETAQQVIDIAKELGWSISTRGSIVEITKRIKPGCNDSFCKADSEYYSILGLIPQTEPGSMWGTDGGGVGAIAAMNSGRFEMKKSGCSKRVVNALQKML